MKEEQIDKLIEEISGLKLILLFQTLVQGYRPDHKNFVKFLQTAGIPMDKIRTMFITVYGEKYVERVMSG